jgi:OOP family OmpA-OmpF porin
VPGDRPSWESDDSLTGGFPGGGSETRAPYDPASADLSELRELLLGAERRRLRALEERLDAGSLTRDELADLLPEAIALRTGRDRQLARALAPTVESAIGESVRRNPREIATAIFPVLGPAIRKAIAESLASLVASINGTIEHSLSPRGLRWRLEAWRTGVPFAQIVLKHSLVYRVEQVFLVHAETGLLLAQAPADTERGADGDLVSGMLTAIRDFVADSFSPERDAGGLRRFSVGELTVMVEQGPQAVLAAVVRGQAPDSLLATMQETLESIHLQFAAPLADFDGDSLPFVAAEPMLQGCLTTVLSTDRAAASRTSARPAWLPYAVGLGLLALLVAWLGLRAERRFSAAVARLDSEPGIVVARADRAGPGWTLSGLRDPLAANPMSLLAAMNIDTMRVRHRWKPFLSMEPAMVLARARGALSVPASITTTLAGDTLRLTGSALPAWLSAIAGGVALPPGIAHVDLSAVTLRLPPALDSVVASIERERVLFEVGQSSLSAAARASIARVATAFGRLRGELGVAGARMMVELTGRSDPTGSDSTNRALSGLRADAVAGALAVRGVEAAIMHVQAAGTSSPIEAADPAQRARLNRSVSFQVRIR